MLNTGSAAKSSFFALCSFYTDATVMASSKLEKPQLNEIDRILLYFHENKWDAVLLVGQADDGKKNFQSSCGWFQT